MGPRYPYYQIYPSNFESKTVPKEKYLLVIWRFNLMEEK